MEIMLNCHLISGTRFYFSIVFSVHAINEQEINGQLDIVFVVDIKFIKSIVFVL